MKKEQQISEYLKQPLKIGDKIQVKGLGLQNKNQWGSIAEVTGFDGDFPIIKGTLHNFTVKEEYRKWQNHLGENPFAKNDWRKLIDTMPQNIEILLHTIGFNKTTKTFKKEKIGNHEIDKLNWQPFFEVGGKEVFYQRDFEWSQEDKQLLIDSIYNYMNLGTIVLRYRPYEWIEKRLSEGKYTTEIDIVDGKQRLHTIVSFIKNEFADSTGNYWEELSDEAQNKFLSTSISVGVINENATDKDVKSTFLNINIAGKQISKQHLEYVKSITL